MARQSTTQARMIDAGGELLSRRGYGRVTMIEVIDRAEAPRGSIYHHFPGGKEELAIKVAAKVGEDTVRLVDWAAERTCSPEAFLLLQIHQHRRRVEASDFTLGCPLVGILANACTESGALRTAVADVLSSWTTAVAQGLAFKGTPAAVARRAATTFVAGVEGAIIMSRASHSTAPFHVLADTVPALLTTPLH